MKRTPILVTALLALTAFSSANTINLTSGSGTLYPYAVAPGFTFDFYGGRYGISIPSAQDLQVGGLYCQACDPFHLDPELFLAEGNFAGDFSHPNGQVVYGSIRFDLVSIVSSHASGGVLTMKYTAVPSLDLFLGSNGKTEFV
jgi:hypothetical protein